VFVPKFKKPSLILSVRPPLVTTQEIFVLVKPERFSPQLVSKSFLFVITIYSGRFIVR
jgi:hypothetical protein